MNVNFVHYSVTQSCVITRGGGLFADNVIACSGCGIILCNLNQLYIQCWTKKGRLIGGDNLIQSSQVSAYSYILYMKDVGNSYTMISWALASFYY